MTQVFVVRSPLNGWALPITEIPDPVFAQGMAGDGIAINPTSSLLCSPFDGVIVSSPKTPHALSIRSDSGIELLMHIGIDTVLLKGAGFKVLATDGERVSSGQALVEFDLEYIASNAVSAVTPVLFTSANGKIISRCMNHAVSIGDVLLEIEYSTIKQNEISTGEIVRKDILVAFDQGIHARPAAQLAALLRPYQATVHILFDSKTANARSMVSVMALGIKHLDSITIEVTGIDAENVMAGLMGFFAAETHSQKSSESAKSNSDAIPLSGLLPAVIASRGLAIGSAHHLQAKQIFIEEQGAGVAFELAALERALSKLSAHIAEQVNGGGAGKHGILEAHAELIQDPTLRDNAAQFIHQGFSAAYAWRQAISMTASAFNASDNAYLRERVADLRDIEQQMLKIFAGIDLHEMSPLPPNSILLTDELLPSQLLAMDGAQIAGICSSGGGPSAHAAIIAAAMGIPFLVAAGPGIHQIANGVHLILDAESGCLQCNASVELLKNYEMKIAKRDIQKTNDLAAAHQVARTSDGTTIDVYANLGAGNEVSHALQQGSEGCGLFRTEFLFLDRQHAPTENEQLQVYQDVLLQMPSKVLTIRTMDIGGDKPIPYMALPKEENPALGLRGIRTSLWNDQLFIDQIRAILRLPQPNQVRILLPMINDVTEVLSVKQYLSQCANELGISALPPLGVMIETPAAAMLADQLLEVVDFVSIGSNDLSQYVLAIDRGHPELAGKLDALHPAVLRLIKHVAQAGSLANKKVSLCGGLASDPAAIPLLIGLGIHQLSSIPAMIPRIKNLIRGYGLEACVQLADKALREKDAVSVRQLASEFNAIIEQGETA